MIDRVGICSRCGGWLEQDISLTDIFCDNCGRKIIGGYIDDSDCNNEDKERGVV